MNREREREMNTRLLTQWCFHIPIIMAGPKLRAGFILAPVETNYNGNIKIKQN